MLSVAWHDLAPALVRDHLAKAGPGMVVEVGVWRGELSTKLLQVPHLTKLWMVDPWLATYAVDNNGTWYINGPGNTQAEMDASYAIAKGVAESAGMKAEILKRPSVEAATAFMDGTLAAVLIDAQHFRDQVIEDLQAWMPKLRSNGLLMGDDFSDYYPGVQAGVEAVLGDNYTVLGQTWWRKPCLN